MLYRILQENYKANWLNLKITYLITCFITGLTLLLVSLMTLIFVARLVGVSVDDFWLVKTGWSSNFTTFSASP